MRDDEFAKTRFVCGKRFFVNARLICFRDEDFKFDRDLCVSTFRITDLQGASVRGIFRRPHFAKLLRQLTALNFRVGQFIRGGCNRANDG